MGEERRILLRGYLSIEVIAPLVDNRVEVRCPIVIVGAFGDDRHSLYP